ncbi:cytosolic carboxypeptidase 3 isoform X14 [Arvicola amphibius]|uniref:cytosolic carboxypeptidase 3 isoform X14 n=1 Tax=Arvicola amphibius TaxID=1047088 RepID=UPI0018E34837|nr:cytosolic carboxypeptidase 3 isoform X14 [Arvicola amphibius]
MSEDSEEEDYSDRSISDDDESDEVAFVKFVSDDIHRCAVLAADSIGDPFFPRTTQILLEYQLGRWVPRLREPRDLYGVSSSGPLSPTRWPYHCEVIDEKVRHIAMIIGGRVSSLIRPSCLESCINWTQRTRRKRTDDLLEFLLHERVCETFCRTQTDCL